MSFTPDLMALYINTTVGMGTFYLAYEPLVSKCNMRCFHNTFLQIPTIIIL